MTPGNAIQLDQLGTETASAHSGQSLPSWVTPQLIDQTIRVFQPYYSTPLTAQDAFEIIYSVARLTEVLAPHASR